jgi:hypothetical protein
MVEKLDSNRFKRLLEMAQRDARLRIAVDRQLANVVIPVEERDGEEPTQPSTDTHSVGA